jgi:hypothetical protein
MTSEARRLLALGVLAVLAGVLIVAYGPPLSLQQSLEWEPVADREGSQEYSSSPAELLVKDAVLSSAGAVEITLVLLVPLALALAAYAVARKTVQASDFL